jgi:hypothetical protein
VKERRTGWSKESYGWNLCGAISDRKGEWTGTKGGRKERQIRLNNDRRMNRIRNEKHRERGGIRNRRWTKLKIEKGFSFVRWKVNCGLVRKEGTRSGGRDGQDVE